MSLEITNLTKRPINKEFFRKVFNLTIAFALKKYRRKPDLSLVFVGEKRIRDLNKKYRARDEVTDELSFPVKENNFIGEIFISYPTIVKRSLRLSKEKGLARNLTLKYQLADSFIHAILHLLGFDHEKSPNHKRPNQSAQKMLQLQEKILSKISKS